MGEAGEVLEAADAAWWLGDVEEASAVLEEAYRRHLEAGSPGPAAMAAIGVGVNHLLRGDGVVGSGWLGRAQRALQDQPERVEHGYLLYMELEGALGEDDPETVVATARRVRDIGRRHADPNLVAAGDLFEGRALVRQAGWPRAWPCSTRPCWPCSRASCARSTPATSTAT